MPPASSNSYLLVCGAAFAIAGAACDLRSRRIPNWLTGSAVLIALALHSGLGGRRAFVNSLAACLMAGAVFAVMFFMGGMGGGDVKLMAAMAAFAGLGRLAQLLITTALAGGAFAVMILVAHGAFLPLLRRAFAGLWRGNAADDLASNRPRKVYLPYGVPIAVGTLLTFYSGVLAS